MRALALHIAMVSTSLLCCSVGTASHLPSLSLFCEYEWTLEEKVMLDTPPPHPLRVFQGVDDCNQGIVPESEWSCSAMPDRRSPEAVEGMGHFKQSRASLHV